MFLSIIVPVYNVEQYLERCVDSLLDQGDFDDYEIILVDDGSIDNSLQICREYAKKNSTIKVYHKNNGGAASARNYGINQAIGDYIMFVDADDYIVSNCMHSIKSTIEKFELDIMGINYLYVYNNGRKETNTVLTQNIKPVNGVDFLINNLRNNTMQMMPVKYIYYSDLIKDNNVWFREGYKYEDEHWVPRAVYYGKRVMQTDSLVYAYCIREDSVSRSDALKEAGALDLMDNCYSLYCFVKALKSNELKALMENNLCTLFLSAAYSGRINKISPEMKSFLRSLNVDKKNNKKRKIFLINKKLYYSVNSFTKRLRIFFTNKLLN